MSDFQFHEMFDEALVSEKRYFAHAQLHGPRTALPAILSSDWNDTKHFTNWTGGARRTLVSIPLLHVLNRNTTTSDREKAFAALRSWCMDQVLRPFSWWPWEFTCDGYSCILEPARDSQTVVGPPVVRISTQVWS